RHRHRHRRRQSWRPPTSPTRGRPWTPIPGADVFESLPRAPWPERVDCPRPLGCPTSSPSWAADRRANPGCRGTQGSGARDTYADVVVVVVVVRRWTLSLPALLPSAPLMLSRRSCRRCCCCCTTMCPDPRPPAPVSAGWLDNEGDRIP
ncbi:unnamed protein product, partial [Scytosiphon promiscuus]